MIARQFEDHFLGNMVIYRVTLECSGVPADEGDEPAKDIAKEFAEGQRL